MNNPQNDQEVYKKYIQEITDIIKAFTALPQFVETKSNSSSAKIANLLDNSVIQFSLLGSETIAKIKKNEVEIEIWQIKDMKKALLFYFQQALQHDLEITVSHPLFEEKHFKKHFNLTKEHNQAIL